MEREKIGGNLRDMMVSMFFMARRPLCPETVGLAPLALVAINSSFALSF